MNPNDYQKACLRTECDEGKAYKRLGGQLDEGWLDRQGISNIRNVRLLHGIVGLTTETGELATLLKKHVFYGQPLDTAKVGDEAGDVLWYLSLALDAVGLKLEDVMAANLRKLKVRFPEKFTEEQAADEVRDREAEAKVHILPAGVKWQCATSTCRHTLTAPRVSTTFIGRDMGPLPLECPACHGKMWEVDESVATPTCNTGEHQWDRSGMDGKCEKCGLSFRSYVSAKG